MKNSQCCLCLVFLSEIKSLSNKIIEIISPINENCLINIVFLEFVYLASVNNINSFLLTFSLRVSFQ